MPSLVYRGLVISIFCFGASMAISEEMQEMAKMLHDTCVSQTGVDENLIVKCRTGDFSEDSKLKCYMKCLMDELSVIGDDGQIDEEMVISMLPEELAADGAPVVRACGTVKGADDCDTIYQTQKCYYKEKPEIYFLL